MQPLHFLVETASYEIYMSSIILYTHMLGLGKMEDAAITFSSG
jgi:hypothetical protein